MSSGLRKAALTLAGLGEQDRAWLLERLQMPERTRVADLLEELHGMRVAVDQNLVRRLALEPAPAATGLAGADAETALRALREEPDWLIAQVLRARAWGWSAEFLRAIGVERGRRILDAQRDIGELRPRTLARILAALDARVESQAGEPPPRKPSWRERLPWRR